MSNENNPSIAERIESLTNALETFKDFQYELASITPDHIHNVGIDEVMDYIADVIFELEEELEYLEENGTSDINKW